MIKQIRKSKKSKVSSRTKSRSKFQRGGDTGRYVLPSEYFGNNSGAYFANGSNELNSCGQHAVSQGMIHQSGRWAGPDLKPMMSGGSCGCSGKKGRSSNNNRRYRNKTKKTKRNNRKH